MKKFAKTLTCILLMTLTVTPINGQEKDIKYRIAEEVQQMNDYISFMADKANAEKTRLYYRDEALNLFIGKGQAYEEDGVMRDGVMMQITSKTYNTVTNKLMRNYFWNLIKGLNYYTEIEITATDAAEMKVSDLRPIGDNMYECTCQYVQVFIGRRDGQIVYKDRTTKMIKCRVVKEDTEDGEEFVTMLGDVYALSTE